MIGPITRVALKALPNSPASGTKHFIWDSQLRGLGAYKTSDGQVTFVYQYRMRWKTTRRMLIGRLSEMTIEQARDRAMVLAQQRRSGVDPVDARRAEQEKERASSELILATYARNYLERRIAGGTPLNKAQTSIVTRDVIGLLGEHRLDALKTHHVETFANKLGERAVSARRMGLVYLKAILNDAKRRGVIVASPADAVETPKSGVRIRRLRPDEIQRFSEAASDISDARGDALQVILRTLKRKEEISSMRWEDVHLPSRTWTLQAVDTKGRRPWEIVLPTQVIAIIERQQSDPALRRGPIFTLDEGRTSPEMGSQVKDLLDANVHRRLELANARDGTHLRIGHYTIHDVRTSGASTLQEEPLRIPVDTINAILLHVVGSGVTQVYLQSGMNREAGEALQRWNDWLDALMAKDSSWPGGHDLPKLRGKEVARRVALLRDGWPQRTDQVRAKAKKDQESKKRSRGAHG